MPCRPRPEAEEEPPRCDTAQRLRTIERWLQHTEEELLCAPDAQGEAAATPSTPATLFRWGGGGMWGSWPSCASPWTLGTRWRRSRWGVCRGGGFPFTYQGQLYHGRVIERLVSRTDGLVELHVQAAPGEEHAPEGEPLEKKEDPRVSCTSKASRTGRFPSTTWRSRRTSTGTCSVSPRWAGSAPPGYRVSPPVRTISCSASVPRRLITPLSRIRRCITRSP